MKCSSEVTVVNCNGMYRSGSAMTFNFMQELNDRENLGLEIAKKHQRFFENDYVLNLYTFRDIRDVMRSFCIKNKQRLMEFSFDGKNYEGFLEHIMGFDYYVKAIQLPNKIVFPYEENLLPNVVLHMLDFFNIDDSKADYYIDKFSLENVRKRLPKEGIEEATQFHSDHIYDGQSGRWLTFFTYPERIALYKVTNLIYWLKINGYFGDER